MKKLIVLFLATAGLLLAAPTQPINNATLTGTTNLGAVGTINNTTGDIATQGSVTTGSGSSVAGTLGLKQGTAPTVVANTVQHIAPTSVTGYNEVDEATVGVTGYYKGTVSGTTATKTKVATIPAADVASGALANGMTATTQSAADNSTKLATTAYADAAVAAGVTASSTTTFTNKRITARVGSTTSSATPTINTDNYDVYKLTAQAADITSMTTNLSGTPIDGDQLELRITGTAARAITWGTGFVAGPAALPTTTTTTKTLYVYFEFDSVVTHWVCMYSGSLP